ncbi:MAG: hypothetical protein LBI42_07305 [Chitinispirillales bacterium]|jgi:hypothetical protein|nr:hypothetical protein [Chitinispirillales bacterium]
MATIFMVETDCYVCGKKNRFPQSGPIMDAGSSRDLDGRPSGLGRSNIYMRVQRCIYCGYCNLEVSGGHEIYREIVKSEPYRAMLNSKDQSETANAYLCCSLLLRHSREWSEAGWSALHAAWICDDNKYSESAARCRKLAFDFFTKTRESNVTFADSLCEEQILFVDILRRNGKFDEAKKICVEALGKTVDEAARIILNYEKLLIEKQDSKCHTFEQAQEMEESGAF